MNARLITILGPTASGKTTLAAHLAARLGDAEIISADSRQVYRGMDIGTGKDLADYKVGGKEIPFHLIDICEAGEKYNLFRYQQDFHKAYDDILSRHRRPILCGGTGLYIESVLKGYKMEAVPENPELRDRLKNLSLPELKEILEQYKTLHNVTDLDTTKRAIRAIEIQAYYREHGTLEREFPSIDSLIIGVDIDRELRRQRISERLRHRLEQEDMVGEVRRLLERVPADDLLYYGLEYKYLTLYVLGRLSYDEMVQQLETSIHQFAKRQMTWFRGMERRGFTIHWIQSTLPLEERVEKILSLLD
ncbi:MAG: tRNA (adenosine(37)-N6)-dimethylallyltransferase MiaA [Bacteroidaceae bacterium]|nr:tRNA (adenosine(37)-N6)-dimethylallyltransferase MiaA [Bacteroidaceae bacterium]MBQ8454973.1 tRNA (adenosine(37)-N6)-dimethylallyltransferase MiaA [Bacteroidaceae bacterium]MBQ9170652.1 tRNA (adenosine(37)-N6)-dimethylallyltransferase MiaA [Bacteroidaceae bacterium]MBQ9293481.1 tRNA (adenosine(37)-N6)-dimethylallyltransferase MiaA [Bacteroidaceae bacterium]